MVAVGWNMQGSIPATATLKELGVPFVLARATCPVHTRILRKVGADMIVQPEREVGERLARAVASRRTNEARPGRARASMRVLIGTASRGDHERPSRNGSSDDGAKGLLAVLGGRP